MKSSFHILSSSSFWSPPVGELAFWLQNFAQDGKKRNALRLL